MSFEITGKLVAINDTQHVSDRFKKREFVLELAGTSWEILEIDDENEEVETKKKPSK